ncbi:MAG: type II secretion system F family protein [Aquificaceae bacterium]
MPKYRYKAFNEAGSIVEAEVEYPDQEALAIDLQSKGLTLINVSPLAEEKGKDKGISGFSIPIGGKVKDKDLSLFCRQLGTMVGAGLSVVDALNILAEQLPNKKLADASKEVARMISEGMPISASMAKFPSVFPEFIVNLVSVGEETGNLDLALIRAAEYYEKMAFIKSKIKSASFYPTFVVIIATAIVTGILYFLVPTFVGLYKGLGGELPLPTQMLIAASDALRSKIIYIIASIVGFSFLFRFLMKSSYQFKKAVHAFMLRAPKMGELVMKSTMAKFSRSMATLFTSGVALERAFDIAGKVAGNVIIKEALEKAKKNVIEGSPMYKALENTGMFPRLIIAMVRVGEDTGKLDEMLDAVAKFYEDEFDKAVEGIIKLIEPMLMVFIGGVVGLILMALYMPIFKLGELIK